jgi:hypothetical protein
MITTSERHFLQDWQDQKSGPKWKFYLLFSIAWAVVSFLMIFFLTKLFTNLWETGGQRLIYIIIGASVLSGFLSTHFTYVINERRFQKITKKINSN